MEAMEPLPRKAVVAAVVVLVLLALLGTYQGWRRSAGDEAQTAADGSPLPVTAAVAGARPASALVEAPPTPLTEAQVRDIARQEIRASLRGDSAGATESAPSASTTNTTTPIGGAPAPRPAQAAPAASPPPVPEPSGAANAPLF
jgi:hypothetical protein